MWRIKQIENERRLSKKRRIFVHAGEGKGLNLLRHPKGVLEVTSESLTNSATSPSAVRRMAPPGWDRTTDRAVLQPPALPLSYRGRVVSYQKPNSRPPIQARNAHHVVVRSTIQVANRISIATNVATAQRSAQAGSKVRVNRAAVPVARTQAATG
jgi:hypothetical protein